MPLALRTSCSAPGIPLHHFWSTCVGAGRANEGLRATWRRHLERAIKECGFRYVRFHGLFHDDMFVYCEQEGNAVFNFQYVDDLFDGLLDRGIKPFVEFGFCPKDMAAQTATVFWWKGNGAPPTDYDKWERLVEATLRHWVARYGIDEVRTWYFEVWNEPNLGPFFKGTRAQYFELYRVSARAIKRVDMQLRVGGPATSNFVPDARFDGESENVACHAAVTKAAELDALDWRPVWIREFLAFCEHENIPVDFVSCHPYPTDWALDELGTGKNYTRGIDSTRKDLALLRRMVNESPFPNAEIHLTEWSSSPSPRDFTHDYPQAAAFIVKTNLDSIGLVDSLSYWVFTDVFEESGAGDAPFHGGFGMINYQDIVKPSFHAYRFLNHLGDELLARVPGGVITRHRDTGRLTALLTHYPSEIPQAVPASFGTREVAEKTLGAGRREPVVCEWTGLPPHCPILVETVGVGRGDAMHAWKAMGLPASLTRDQTRLLQQAADNTRREFLAADATGRFVLMRELAPWDVVQVRQL